MSRAAFVATGHGDHDAVDGRRGDRAAEQRAGLVVVGEDRRVRHGADLLAPRAAGIGAEGRPREARPGWAVGVGARRHAHDRSGRLRAGKRYVGCGTAPPCRARGTAASSRSPSRSGRSCRPCTPAGSRGPSCRSCRAPPSGGCSAPGSGCSDVMLIDSTSDIAARMIPMITMTTSSSESVRPSSCRRRTVERADHGVKGQVSAAVMFDRHGGRRSRG